jgi:hypothetical protein
MEYNAIKTHFNSKKYDYHKYHGKTNVPKETFLRRKDRYSFIRMAKKYSLEDAKSFFIANLVYRSSSWVGDMLTPEGEDAFKMWQKNNQSLQYLFKSDIMKLTEKYENPLVMLQTVDGQLPPLLKDVMCKDIMIETLTIMNDIMGFFNAWDKTISDDIIWPEYRMKCVKYAPFIEYDKSKFKQIIKEQCSV